MLYVTRGVTQPEKPTFCLIPKPERATSTPPTPRQKSKQNYEAVVVARAASRQVARPGLVEKHVSNAWYEGVSIKRVEGVLRERRGTRARLAPQAVRERAVPQPVLDRAWVQYSARRSRPSTVKTAAARGVPDPRSRMERCAGRSLSSSSRCST